MADNIAVSEAEINKLIMDLDDYAIKARRIFNQIECVVNNLNKDCESEFIKKYINRFKKFENNFGIMSNNILSYKKDLQNIKSYFKNQQSIASRAVREQTKKIVDRR